MLKIILQRLMALLQLLEGDAEILRDSDLHNALSIETASSGVMLGSDSTCFILRLMMRANLYVSSNCSILFHRRMLILTVTLLGVLSTIVVILLKSIALQIYTFFTQPCKKKDV